VCCKVIQEDDVTVVEARQTSFDIGAKDLSIERAIEHRGCHGCVMAQAG
jgi:hypothetical protein